MFNPSKKDGAHVKFTIANEQSLAAMGSRIEALQILDLSQGGVRGGLRNDGAINNRTQNGFTTCPGRKFLTRSFQ